VVYYVMLGWVGGGLINGELFLFARCIGQLVTGVKFGDLVNSGDTRRVFGQKCRSSHAVYSGSSQGLETLVEFLKGSAKRILDMSGLLKTRRVSPDSRDFLNLSESASGQLPKVFLGFSRT